MTFSCQLVVAQELYEMHKNARALGMGGAYIAVVDDENSLFYNPAGIAKNLGFHWTILDVAGGVSPNALEIVSNPTDSAYSKLQDPATFQEGLSDLVGDPLWVGGSGNSSVILPFFAAAYYRDIDGSFFADNPVNPALTVNYVDDSGIALGTGWSIGGILQMGFALKKVSRTGIRKTYGAATIAEIVNGGGDPSEIIFDEIKNTKGTGYALDYGMNITVPAPVSPTFSLAWTNVGNTKFTATDELSTAPPSEVSNLSVGASLMVDAFLVHVLPSVEFRRLLDSEAQLTKKLHLGLEVGLPIITARAGLYQGYITYGLGIDLGLVNLDFAKWTTELGAAPGQMPSERYLVELSLRLGFDFMGGGSSGGSSGKGGGKSGSSSSSSSKRKMKVRR